VCDHHGGRGRESFGWAMDMRSVRLQYESVDRSFLHDLRNQQYRCVSLRRNPTTNRIFRQEDSEHAATSPLEDSEGTDKNHFNPVVCIWSVNAVESGDPHRIDPWKERHSGCLSCVCSVFTGVDFLRVTRYSMIKLTFGRSIFGNTTYRKTFPLLCAILTGPAIIRRHGAAYAARVGWIARGLGARRGMQNELELDEEEFWESVVDNMEMAAGDEAESAIESLAMEVSGMAGRNRLLNNTGRFANNASGRRLLEAARVFSQSNRESAAPDTTELLRAATANAASYQPRWVNPSQLSTRGRSSGNDIQVGEGERQNLARLPSGAAEGRAIRAEEPLPRSEPFGAIASALPGPRRTFGFRVAFDHPSTETGGNMGGCHLLGVTTSSFTAYGEQNGLQQSPFFWGIEDGGQKYEGSQYNSARTSRRAYSSFRNDFVSQDAPLNAANVLFGCREVVTVVCDYESRTLTFWRDGTLLGSLVTNLPRSGNLFPVAVPFNGGVTVAITGLNEDPLPL
jgi:hypothetical protein